jgi:hypothetical protein
MKKTALLAALLLSPLPGWSVPASSSPLLEALVSPAGVVTVRDGAAIVATIEPGFYLAGWSRKSAAGARPGGFLDLGGQGKIRFEASATQTGGALELHYSITPSVTLVVETAHVSILLPVADWIGATASTGSETAVVPDSFREVTLLGKTTSRFTLGPARIRRAVLEVKLVAPGNILLQDSRKWGPELEVRLATRPNNTSWTWNSGETKEFALVVGFGGRIRVVHDTPVTIKEGRDWVPMAGSLDITPFSALDFGGIIPRFPAGVAGWVRSGQSAPDTFELEKRRGIPLRFYGANLCYSAQYLSNNDADRVAERLMHIGYNSVRLHHYESVPWVPGAGLVSPTSPDSTVLKGENLDKLEYLVSALKKRGIYVTLDLFVSRSVRSGEVFPGTKGDLGFQFKRLVHVSDRAFNNWKEFSRALLNHKNPYTGLAWKDDPAIALISLVNEDNLANDTGALQADPREKALWEKAWYRWPRRQGKPDWNSPLFHRFLWETQQATGEKMVKFLREELGVKALLTDINGWTDEWGAQAYRSTLNYVDNHWYWDHPAFLEKDWQLPSRGTNTSAITNAGEGWNKSFTRLLDRPFTITEFNHAAPNRFTAESGLLAGAYAAVQGWGGIWRFTYSSERENIISGNAMNYFDLATDPVRLASERVGLALFLRGDLAQAPGTLAVTGTTEEFLARSGTSPAGDLNRLGWCVRMGSLASSSVWGTNWIEMPLSRRPEAITPDALLALLKSRLFLSATNLTDPSAGVYETATGDALINTRTGIMSVSTARTVALAGPAGTAKKLGPVSLSIGRTWAMVSVISLDGNPLSGSGKILVTHLTELKNSGEKFAGQDQAVLEDWGKAPWLVRAGRASVRISRPNQPSAVEVWRLSLNGQRTVQVPAEYVNGAVTFEASTSKESGATLDYEVVITP